MFTDCPGCALCDLLRGTGTEVVTIHPYDDGPDESWATEKANDPRPQTVSRSRSRPLIAQEQIYRANPN